MTDRRFYSSSGPLSLQEIATRTGSTLAADADGALMIHDVGSLASATKSDISFLTSRKYLQSFRASGASACFVTAEFAGAGPDGMALLINDHPKLAYAIIAAELFPAASAGGEISAGASIDPSARIGEATAVQVGTVIEADVKIGRGCSIGANTVIGAGVSMGDGCRIAANVTITHSLLGSNVIVHAGVRIGQDGFGYVPGPLSHCKIPHFGRVIIGDEVEIGANTTIDRGAVDDTVIGDGTKIDNLCQVGHNCKIGKNCILCAQVGLSGSVILEDFVVIGGKAGVADHVRIGMGTQLAAGSGVMSDTPPGSAFGGYPSQPIRDWHRTTIALRQLIKGPKRHGKRE